MVYATLSEEKKLWKRGYKSVACLDEAGRGPLAGPVVAAAAIVRGLTADNLIHSLKVKDSKQLSAKQRGKFYKLIIRNKNIKWGIGVVSEKVIDKINILEATKLAMKRALKKLKADYLILDGRIKLNLSLPQKSIVKGDERVFSCALASIIAKVTRDRIMMKYHKKYPEYGFDRHKGYGTGKHFTVLREQGFSKIHRKSFYPVYTCQPK